FTGAPTPGEVGPAVILGHVDGDNQEGIFFRLRELKPGDEVLVRRTDGSTARFVVSTVDTAPKDRFPTEKVYGNTAGPELGRITGTSRMSAWNCMSSSLTTMPPSTFSALSGTPESAFIASMTSRVWYAVASSTARARWPLLTNRVRPTIAPRASERQYGANSPENAGTK